MKISFNFDERNVKLGLENQFTLQEFLEITPVKILMLKGDKGDTVSAQWSTITGDISTQTDLQDALDTKADKSTTYTKTEVDTALEGKADTTDIPDVSNFITKDVNNLTNYTKTSDLSEVATSGDYDDLTNKPTLFSGSYSDLTNKPTIPSTTSDLTNDSGFIDNTVNNLANYTTTSDLNTALNNIEDGIEDVDQEVEDISQSLGVDTNTYDNTATYSVGDKVIYENKIYECNTAISTAEDFDSSKWDLVPVIDNMKLNPKLNKYSTSEEKIGTWIDGKPIYRKVVVLTSFTAGETVINHNISNIDKVINVSGFALRKSGEYEILPVIVPPNIQSDFQISIYDINDTRFRMYLGRYTVAGDTTLTNMYIIFEYTKTTD